MDVSVVIVSYHSARHIGDCLAPLLAQGGVSFEVIVVDNASQDDTLAAVGRYGNRVRLIQNAENRGFGKACNQGFDASRGRFLYLLNPDAQLQENDALARLCRVLDAHPTWGMAGTCLLDSDGVPEPPPETDYPGQSLARNEFGKLPGRFAWVVGASMFVRREVHAQLGGFDPDFFLYGEEIDFCLRLREKGHEIGFVEEVRVRHLGGASEAGRDPYDVWTRRTNGIHLFWRKHYAADDVCRLVRRDASRARRRMLVNGVLARVLPSQSRAWQKYRRHRAVWDVSLKFLSSPRPTEPRQA